jgi:NAD(P)-dependent dehydrogenase (short-subunit alcohol dehydrogenase family)
VPDVGRDSGCGTGRGAVAYIGAAVPSTWVLADAVGATVRIVAPDLGTDPPGYAGPDPWRGPAADRLAAFRAEIAALDADRIVVCTWSGDTAPADAVEVDLDRWRRDVESPLAWWSSAVVAAATSCRDGGSVVVVVEHPAALDAAGHSTTVAVGEGLFALARSAALAMGARRVRVNVVSTEVSTAPRSPLGSPPPLASFPGRVEVEVAGAVRMLLGDDAVGVTGTVVRADCGRSW